jgi:PAS domain S-box-containing protein
MDHTETRLRRSEERMARILETLADGILILNADGRVAFANAALERMLGLPRRAALGRGYDDWRMEAPDGEPLPGGAFAFLRVARTGRSVHDLDCATFRPDGTRALLSISAAPLRDRAGALDAVVVSVRDVSDRKRAEGARLERERMRALSRRLLEVQETERRRIARELHDEAGQALTALRLVLEGAAAGPGVELSSAKALVEDLAARLRALSQDLRPSMLDDLGLLPALLALFERHSQETGLRVRFEHSGLDSRVAPEVETALYRVAQEALTNVARHAGCRDATVRAWRNDYGLHLQVEDAGAGFDAEEALAAGTAGGLSGMRDRVLLLGGRFALESGPGAGARVWCELPLLD